MFVWLSLTIKGYLLTYLLTWNRSSAKHSAYSYTFFRSVVCLLSVVCNICALCLNCSTDLDNIWQVHLWFRGPVTYCVRWGFLTPGNGEIWRSTRQAKNAIANCVCHLTNRNEERFRLLPNYFGLVISRLKIKLANWWNWQRILSDRTNSWKSYITRSLLLNNLILYNRCYMLLLSLLHQCSHVTAIVRVRSVPCCRPVHVLFSHRHFI